MDAYFQNRDEKLYEKVQRNIELAVRFKFKAPLKNQTV